MLEPELVLQGKVSDAKKEVRKCLCDDFDTPGAVVALQEVVKAVNKVGGGREGGREGGRGRVLCFFFPEGFLVVVFITGGHIK